MGRKAKRHNDMTIADYSDYTTHFIASDKKLTNAKNEQTNKPTNK